MVFPFDLSQSLPVGDGLLVLALAAHVSSYNSFLSVRQEPLSVEGVPLPATVLSLYL